MIKKEEKLNKRESEARSKKIIADIEGKLDYCASNRFAAEKMWWDVQSFVDGYHYNIFKDNKSTNTIELRSAKFKTGEVKRVINLVRKIYRDMKSMIAVASYRWTVIGGSGNEDKYLQDFFDEYSVGKTISKVAGLGFRRSVGYVEVYWDGKKVCLDPVDPFILYRDPGKQFYIKSYIRRLQQLKEVKDGERSVYSNLDKDKMEVTDKQTNSDLYNFIYKREHPGETNKDNDELKNYLITELIEPGEGATAKITTKSGTAIIREEELSAYKIIPYSPEEEDDIYTNPMLEPTLHPAKALNRTINHEEEYIRYMCQGRYAVRKGEKVTELKGQHGHQIEYLNRAPTQMNIEPLPSTVHTYLDLMISLHSQLTGMRLQQLPSNLSGKAIAFYQAVEQQNATEPMENLKIFMREVAMAILEIAESKESVSKKIYYKEEEEVKELDIVGANTITSESIKEGEDSKYKPIKKPARVEVEILPGGAFALLNQKEEAKELYQAGLIGRKQALTLSKIGNLREVIEEAEAEEEREAELAAKYGQQPGGEVPVGGGSPQETVARELPESIPARPSML